MFHADSDFSRTGAFLPSVACVGAVVSCLFFVLPDGARLGGEAWKVAANLVTASDALQRQNVPFGVINERSLPKLPASAKAL